MDIQNLKMKDLAEVETITGLNMDEWESGSKAKLTVAIAYVTGKKTNPELTLEEVENMTVDELTAFQGSALPKANIS